MPAGITNEDGMFSVRETPWHGLGIVPKKPPKDIAQALKWASLDWDVAQYPVAAVMEETEDTIAVETLRTDPDDFNSDPLYYVNVRSDTNRPLGIVTGRYTPVQNVEAFEFIDNLIGSSMHFETAGSLQGGRRVWVMARLPEYVEVGGDPIGQYVFISNSHDGKSSVLAALTPVRIVCQNTLSWAVSKAKGQDAKRTYTIRHLGDMSSKIAEARNVLDITINYYEQFAKVGDKLATVKFTDKKAADVLKKIFPTDENMGDRAATNREEARLAVMNIFKGEGANPETVGNAPGTAWCLANAVTEYSDWFREERKEGGRFQRVLDDPDSAKTRAFDVTLAAAGLR